ncbi:hypothetical protein Tco_0657386 [Tanacetum coccineum]|uniref:Retroviral polymerase SH3-like domain-containing protein n=1 Tax=Tanacetum coccineum TaxID=301880 RepID=A0ABQ4XC12_9ASTR
MQVDVMEQVKMLSDIPVSATTRWGSKTKRFTSRDLGVLLTHLGRKEVYILKKTENQAKMTKLSRNGKDCAKSTSQSQKSKVIVQYEEYFDAILTPSDAEKPNILDPFYPGRFTVFFSFYIQNGIFVGYVPAKKAFRIYNRRNQIITETIHVTFDELTEMASEQFSSGPGLQGLTPATPSTGLVSNPVSQQPCIPPIRDDYDRLFQPMFDEYFNPPPIAVSPIQEAAALRAEVLADSPVSSSIDQDAPSTSIPSSQERVQPPIISQGFEESPKTPTFHDDPLNESPNEYSTSNGSSSNVRQIHTPFEHLGRWTKDHPIANVIGDPSRFVSTRKKLEIDAMWCYFDAFLTSVEPKNFK